MPRNLTSITTASTTIATSTTKPPRTVFLTGTIQMYAGSTEPLKPWLFCNGSKISRVEYERLFAVIGEAYGPGDENTTFNLPDFRGRVPVGLDELKEGFDDADTLGSVGGQILHQITLDQLPPHRHEPSSLSASSDGSHSHSIYDPGHNHGGETGSAWIGTTIQFNATLPNYKLYYICRLINDNIILLMELLA